MLNAECLLKSFAAFATEHGQTHVRAQTAIEWAARGPSAAQRDTRLKATAVRQEFCLLRRTALILFVS